MPTESNTPVTNTEDITSNAPNSPEKNPQTKKKDPEKPSGGLSDEQIAMLQTLKEEVKFEMKQELTQSLNAKSQQLADVDPVVSTCLKAAAGAINESISDVIPVGGNDQFNAKKMQEQQSQQNAQNLTQQAKAPQQTSQKTASDAVSKIVFDTSIKKLTDSGYFEKVADMPDDVVNDAVCEVIEIVSIGMEKFGEDNDIDFTDSNYSEILKELIMDSTLYEIGKNEIENK